MAYVHAIACLGCSLVGAVKRQDVRFINSFREPKVLVSAVRGRAGGAELSSIVFLLAPAQSADLGMRLLGRAEEG